MDRKKVIAIFDIGKTNKKTLLFDETLNLVYTEMIHLPETKDEDGFPCEDIKALTDWVSKTFEKMIALGEYQIIAVNFSAYGASFVYLDEEGKTILPLYNYLKPYPEDLKNRFYSDYGGEVQFAKQTASPVLGSLNSGLQVYRIKQERPEIFSKIKYALHLPQYLSYIIGNQVATEITSIGCHTNLWDFEKKTYHPWVGKEGVLEKFPPILSHSRKLFFGENKIAVGLGLHDSSAALVPYLHFFKEQFVLISTGTWCISLNPFNHSPLSEYELKNDCLAYLTYEGKSVKASRLFAGMWHEQETKRLSGHFHKPINYFQTIAFNREIYSQIETKNKTRDNFDLNKNPFLGRDLRNYKSYEEAYHEFMIGIMELQVFSTGLILNDKFTKNIYVDGGFGNNEVYMNLLARSFPHKNIYAADMPQASALGAAFLISEKLGFKENKEGFIKLKKYFCK